MFRNFLLALALALAATPLHGGRMVVFGDSLSDGGFFLGARFTDPGGDLWHEYLADALGLERATTSTFGLTGLNFAVGASVVDDLPNQVSRYNNRYTWQSGDLCTLWIGGNDVRSAPGQDMTVLVEKIRLILVELASLDIDRFVVANLPDIGAIPESLDDPAAAAIRSQGTIAFNTALAAMLDDLALTPPITVYRLDVYGLFDQMLFFPADYGFENISEPLNASAGSPPPDTYAFWDEIHPTTRSHFLISTAVLPLIDPGVPIELVSQTIQEDLSLRQTWVANPDLTYQIASGTDPGALDPVGSYTNSPAYTVEIPPPGPDRGFYQTLLLTP